MTTIFDIDANYVATQPDPFQKDYRSGGYYKEKTPVVIDAGAYETRAGWAVRFPTDVGKTNGREREILVGNDVEASSTKVVHRSPFEFDVATNQFMMEHILDHIFSRMGIDTPGSVSHPIVMTESLAIPNYSRHCMTELLFEGYGVPSVAYGVAPLFSLYYNAPDIENALIISSGYWTTHVIPYAARRMQGRWAGRIQLGGCAGTHQMMRRVGLRFPIVEKECTLKRAESIKHEHAYTALKYREELLDVPVHVLQFPWIGYKASDASEKERKRKEDARVENGRRLAQIAKERNAQKKLEWEAKRDALKQALESEHPEEAVLPLGYVSLENAKQTLEEMDEKEIRTMKRKGLLPAVERGPPKADLLSIPSTMLTEEQKVEKKRQQFHMMLWKSKLKRKEDMERKAKEQKEEEERRLADPIAWLEELRSKRKTILSRMQRRQQRSKDLGKRKSLANQQRMRMIAAQAFEDSEEEDDNFGAREEDWHVYRDIAKDGYQEEEEADQESLKEVEQLLGKFDPDFEFDTDGAIRRLWKAEDFQVQLGVNRIAVPEIVWQPSIVGARQCGLTEVLSATLSHFEEQTQSEMCKNVFVTGGNTAFPGFCERVEYELRMNRPYGAPLKVFRAKNPSLDAWRGAARYASQTRQLKASSISKKMFMECGIGYLKEHALSNVWVEMVDE